MPSPFPGMDPFLEQPAVFPDFHNRFIAYLSEFLKPDLPQPYYAAIGSRVGGDYRTTNRAGRFGDTRSTI